MMMHFDCRRCISPLACLLAQRLFLVVVFVHFLLSRLPQKVHIHVEKCTFLDIESGACTAVMHPFVMVADCLQHRRSGQSHIQPPGQRHTQPPQFTSPTFSRRLAVRGTRRTQSMIDMFFNVVEKLHNQVRYMYQKANFGQSGSILRCRVASWSWQGAVSFTLFAPTMDVSPT